MPFATIALAEMGDKTQLAMMALAAKHKHMLQIFLGAMAASIITDGSAVALGNYATKYVPVAAVSVAAGAIFILFGIYSLIARDKKEEKAGMAKSSVLMAAFMLFFISELGDKTQFTALLFGTQYGILLALFGVLAAMALMIGLALVAGKFIHAHLNEKAVRVMSSALFIIIGLFTLAKAAS